MRMQAMHIRPDFTADREAQLKALEILSAYAYATTDDERNSHLGTAVTEELQLLFNGLHVVDDGGRPVEERADRIGRLLLALGFVGVAAIRYALEHDDDVEVDLPFILRILAEVVVDPE